MSTKVVGELLFQMSANIARLKQDMDKAQATVKSATDSMQSAIALTKTALGSLGVGLSVHGFISFIEGGIEAEAALHKLNLQTGISVEMLSALNPIAKQSGTDIDTVAGMVNKLEKNMLSFAQSGGGKAADAFRQLGYTQAQVKAGLQDMDTFLPEFAKRLVEAGVGGEQAGLAMQLMAKGGAAALPFLKQLSEAGVLHAKVTTAQAEAAHQFEVSMVKLNSTSGALARQLANELLPSFNHIATAMLAAKEAGEGFFMMLYRGAQTALTGTDKYKADKELVELTERKLLLEQKLREAQQADDAGFGVKRLNSVDGIKAQMAATDAQIKTVMTYRAELEKLDKAAEPKVNKPLEDPAGKGGKLTDWTDRDEQMYRARVQAMKEIERLDKEALAAKDEQDKMFDDARTKVDALGTSQMRTLNDAIKAQQLYNAEIGKTKDQRDLAKKAIDDAAAVQMQFESDALRIAAETVEMDQRYKDIYIARANALTTEIALRKKLSDLLATASSLDKIAEDTKLADEAARSFGQTMSSALGRMITSGAKGKDVIRSLGDEISQLITKLLVLKPLEAQIEASFKATGGLGGILNAFGFGGVSDIAPGTGGQSFATAFAGGITPMATGTDYVPQDMLALLHKGESVTPAGANAGGDTYVIDARGADQTGMARLESLIRQLNGSIEKRAVMAVNVAYNMRGRRGPLGT